MVSPVTSGLAIELSARSLTGTYNANDTFSTWPDQSGNGNDAKVSAITSSGSAPYYTPNETPNGGPTVTFYGSTMRFQNQAVYDSATSGEIFLVFATPANYFTAGGYMFGGNDNTYLPWQDGNVYDGSFTSSRYHFPAVSPQSYHVYNVSHDGTTRTTRIDGNVVHTVAAAFANPTTTWAGPLIIGAIQSGYMWLGEIAGFIAYNRSLTSAERGQVLSYLQQQHMVTVTDPGGSITAPAIASTLAVRGQLSISVAQISAPALAFTSRMSVLASAFGSELAAAPPVRATLRLPVPTVVSALLTLSSPADGDVVELKRPDFVVGFNAHDQTTTYTVQVQYADNAAFTAATTLTASTTAVDGGVHLTATSDVAADTYWRARLTQNGVIELDWSPIAHFTYSAQLTATDLPVSWKVSTSADRPIHLWHLVPTAASIGDTVVAYGQGMPSHGSVLLGGVPCTIKRWERQAAVIDSISADRHIDDDDVDPEHYEIAFTVPAVDPPGGQLEVST